MDPILIAGIVTIANVLGNVLMSLIRHYYRAHYPTSFAEPPRDNGA